MEYYIRMSLRQWLAMFAFYAMYVFLGASIFYTIEHNLETERRASNLQERIDINELLTAYTSPDDIEIQNKILAQVSDYCGRKVTNHTLDEHVDPYIWNFFHAFYFSFTTCTTVGYGNISPSTSLGRIILCFYALFGIPLSCFFIASVAQFFAGTYYRLRKKYTEYHNQRANTTNYVPPGVGLFGMICLYLTPGLIVFIFLPAIFFSYFEEWDYVRSVYYSFVTLSTVGYGDLVPTFQAHQEREFHFYFLMYEIFIIFWNIAGLGYVLMIINFVAKAMKSKRVAKWEHKISQNIRATEHLVRQEVSKDLNFLRRLLNEVNLMKVKPVYTDEDSKKTYNSLPRSSSCPELSLYRYRTSPQIVRGRSYSVAVGGRKVSRSSTTTLNRSQSDGDLHLIDRKKTFENSTKHFGNSDLMTKVVSALGSIRQYDEDEQSSPELAVRDSQILSLERRCSGWSLNPYDAGFYASRIRSLNGSNQLTWNGSSLNDIRTSQLMGNTKDGITSSRSVNFSRSVSLNMPEDDKNVQNALNKKILHRMFNKTNSSKPRTMSEQGKRHSIVYPEMDSQMNHDRKNTKRGSINSLPREYMSATSKGRNSIPSTLDASKSELLEKTSIADLIRALEIVHTTSRLEDGSANVAPKIRNNLSQANNSRRGSLRPTPGYTTIFSSSDKRDPMRKISSQSTPDSSLFSRHSQRQHNTSPQYTAAAIPNPKVHRFSVRLSNPSPSKKKVPLGPSPLALARNDEVQENVKISATKTRDKTS